MMPLDYSGGARRCLQCAHTDVPIRHFPLEITMSASPKLRCLLATALCAATPLCGWAQGTAAFPSRPVHLVLPTPAGGPSDTAARLVAQALKTAWGQPVNVENRPGASGAIAVQAVMASQADGYTLLWAQGSMAALPILQKNPPYRHMNELAPVSNVV